MPTEKFGLTKTSIPAMICSKLSNIGEPGPPVVNGPMSEWL